MVQQVDSGMDIVNEDALADTSRLLSTD